MTIKVNARMDTKPINQLRKLKDQIMGLFKDIYTAQITNKENEIRQFLSTKHGLNCNEPNSPNYIDLELLDCGPDACTDGNKIGDLCLHAYAS